MYKLLSVFVRYNRDDVRSLDRNRLLRTCDYLNEMADEDISYEVREVPPDE